MKRFFSRKFWRNSYRALADKCNPKASQTQQAIKFAMHYLAEVNLDCDSKLPEARYIKIRRLLGGAAVTVRKGADSYCEIEVRPTKDGYRTTDKHMRVSSGKFQEINIEPTTEALAARLRLPLLFATLHIGKPFVTFTVR